MKKEQPACYTCKWRDVVPGSAHSCCRHPSLERITNDPLAHLLGTFASIWRVPTFVISSDELNIKGNAHAIRNGWFNFPTIFDPIWLENCDGYEKVN